MGFVPENMCTKFDANTAIFGMFKVWGKFESEDTDREKSRSEWVTIFRGFGQILKGPKKSSKLIFDMQFFAACSL